MIKNCGRELKRRCRLFDTLAGTAGANFALVHIFFLFPAVYRRMPSAAAECQSSPGNSLGKYSARWWRYGERGFGGVEELDVERRGRRGGSGGTAAIQNRSRTVGCGTVQSRAKSITHPPVLRSTCSIPVCQSSTRRYRRCRVCKLSTTDDANLSCRGG